MKPFSPKNAVIWFLAMPFLGLVSSFFLLVSGALRWRGLPEALRLSSASVLAISFLAYGTVIMGVSLYHDWSLKALSGAGQHFIPLIAMLSVLAFPSRGTIQNAICRHGVLILTVGVLAMSLEIVFEFLKDGHWNERAKVLSRNPLVLSAMLVPVSLWMLVPKGERPEGEIVRLTVVPVLTITAIVVLAASRMSLLVYIAVLPLAAVILWIERPRLRRTLMATIALVLIALGAGGLFLLTYEGDIATLVRFSALAKTLFHLDFSSMDYSMSARADMYRAGLAAIVEKPLLGYGAHMEAWAFARYMPEESREFEHVHNQYMSFVLQAGLPGLVVGLAALFAPLAAHILGRDQEKSVKSICCVAILVVCFALQGMTDSLFSDVRILWFYGFSSNFLLAWFRLPKP